MVASPAAFPGYSRPQARTRTPREAWFARVVLLAWVVFLAWSGSRHVAEPLSAAGPPIVGPERLVRWLQGLALAAASEAALFIPVGALLVIALPRRVRWWRRLLLVTIPSLLASLALALGLEAAEATPPWVWPGLNTVTIPALGSALGVWMGLAWVGGWRTRLWFLPKLALVAGLLAVGLGAVVGKAVGTEPLPFEPPRVTSAEKRRLAELFKTRNPEKIPEGQTRTLRLSEKDVDLLLAWALPLGNGGLKAKAELRPDESSVLLSARLPGGVRYLNVLASGRARVDGRGLRVAPETLQMGGVEAPRLLVGLLGPPLVDLALDDPRVRPAVAALRSLQVEDGAVAVTYGHTSLPRGFLADLFGGEGASRELAPAVRAYVMHLLDGADALPRGEARFGASLERAFALARSRSAESSAVGENRAAVAGLGILLGHRRVEDLVGNVLGDGERARARRALRGATLRGRGDWTQHFFVSAALTAVAADALSNAAGLFKEQLDADGGSGFSFGDLLADRAGTLFAQAATRDEASAKAVQERLARGFRVDDFFPDAAGLPE